MRCVVATDGNDHSGACNADNRCLLIFSDIENCDWLIMGRHETLNMLTSSVLTSTRRILDILSFTTFATTALLVGLGSPLGIDVSTGLYRVISRESI
jgi:hypothetical protein